MDGMGLYCYTSTIPSVAFFLFLGFIVLFQFHLGLFFGRHHWHPAALAAGRYMFTKKVSVSQWMDLTCRFWGFLCGTLKWIQRTPKSYLHPGQRDFFRKSWMGWRGCGAVEAGHHDIIDDTVPVEKWWFSTAKKLQWQNRKNTTDVYMQV